MDDARGNRLPHAATRRRPAMMSRAPLAVIAGLPLPGLAAAARPGELGWPPEYGWILGAGVACLGVAWLLSRLGARHELTTRGLGPPRTPRAARDPRLRGEDRLARSRAAMPNASPLRLDPADAADLAAVMSEPTAAAVGAAPASPVRPARRRRERLGFDAPRRPSATTAWLHLVSGPTPAHTARSACTVAADLIERGGRVLLVDAGRRCVLHARFGCESRWGIGECLARTLPVLGVVQPTGFSGLHLMARGLEPRLLWEALGRFADDARAHYDHVLVAIDPDTPREAGLAIVGRLVEGWWAGPNLAARAALGLSERLGIVFSALPMGLETEVSLEPGRESPSAGGTAAPAGDGTAPTLAGFEPEGWLGLELPATLAPMLRSPAVDAWRGSGMPGLLDATVGVEHETLVLACDDDVRARLQFLMWVRGMAGTAPAAEPAWKLAGARA